MGSPWRRFFVGVQRRIWGGIPKRTSGTFLCGLNERTHGEISRGILVMIFDKIPKIYRGRTAGGDHKF